MKKFLIFFLACSYTAFLLAQEFTIPVMSKIKEVTVFTNGAQLVRFGNVWLKAGMQKVVFENLPSNLNQQSVQLNGTGSFTILSVTPKVNYLRGQEKSKEIVALEDSIEKLNWKIKQNEIVIGVLQDEGKLLKANQNLGGSQTGVKVDELKAAIELFRLRFTEIGNQTQRLIDINRKTNEIIQRLNNQLGIVQNRKQNSTGEVEVLISASAATQAQLKLSYVIMQAGWIPSYDIRAIDITQPVELTYKAEIRQSTGEDWNNVKLTLSTGNPLLSGTKPELSPWYLNFIEPQRPMYKSSLMMEQRAAPVMMADSNVAMDETSVPSLAKSSAQFANINENQTNIEVSIDVPYDIPSDNEAYTIEIGNNKLQATYEYFCAPKIDNNVFLLAHITGWDNLNLMQGQASVYFEGTYVGQSYLDPNNTGDTLSISLGRDKNIVVIRSRLKDFTSKQWIGNTKKEFRSFEIDIRNKKKQLVNLVLEDQVPVSSNKEIEVEIFDVSGGILNKDEGKVIWKMGLQPSDSKKVKFSYLVSYPKAKKVVLE